MDFNKIVTYPMQSDDWERNLLIGGILVFFGWLFVPLFLVYGYIMRTIRSSLAGEARPPKFSEWEELLVEGVKAWLVSLVYLFVPLVVAGITVGGSLLAIATGSEAGAAAGTGGLFFGFMISAILGLVFGYLAVVAIVNFARKEDFGAAFDFDTIKTVAMEREYAVPWLVSVGVFIVAGFAGGIPLVGWLISPFASFYAAIVAANLWAGGFSEALESTDGITRRKDDEATV